MIQVSSFKLIVQVVLAVVVLTDIVNVLAANVAVAVL